MTRKIISVLGGAILLLLVGVWVYSGDLILPDFITRLVVGIIIMAITPIFANALRKSTFEPKVNPFNPKYDYIEARLFYPRTISWERRDPRKIKPHYKLILIKDLKKAYYVGSYVWNLILTNQIEWVTEDEEDLDEWCGKKGYALIKEDATEYNLLEPCFYAEIKDKKFTYRHGEQVLFYTHYRGNLVNGFFDNEILLPNSKVFSDGKPMTWSWAPDTLDNVYYATKGNLNGYVNHESNWNWCIPQNAPRGEYQIYMRVYNHLDINNRPIIDQKEDTINVV